MSAMLNSLCREQRMEVGDHTLAVIESLTGPLLAAADPSDAAALIAAELTVRTVVRAVLVISTPVPCTACLWMPGLGAS